MEEETSYGSVPCKFRNPLPVKSLMNLLGMPSGPCRRPLGKMTPGGMEVLVGAARQVLANDPELLAPIAEFFGVDVEERLSDSKAIEALTYSY